MWDVIRIGACVLVGLVAGAVLVVVGFGVVTELFDAPIIKTF